MPPPKERSQQTPEAANRQESGPKGNHRSLLPRRQFLAWSGLAGCALLAGRLPAAPSESIPHSLQGRLFKTLKIEMVKIPGSLRDRFRAAKTAGFQGIELNTPGLDIGMTKAAIAATGLPVDGTVCRTHWKIRHTSADPATRAQALADLEQAIRETSSVGGHTVLLVPGKGEDGTDAELWERSIENISRALPLAARLGIVIAIENVWNRFLYDHEGDSNQNAIAFARYIDAFNSPWVGLQFDIGNHWKYGPTGDWIRTLGRRIVKLDVKGFSRAEDSFTPIGEGDIHFADVRKALLEINYHGWIAAEVKGGNLAALEATNRRMNRAFGLA